MNHQDAICIEQRLRSLAGHCQRGEYHIDADLIEPSLVTWYIHYGDSLPNSILHDEVFQKWTETFDSLGKESWDLSEDQLQSFIEEFCPRT